MNREIKSLQIVNIETGEKLIDIEYPSKQPMYATVYCPECKELLKQIEKLETQLKLAEYLNDKLQYENRQIQRDMWLMSLR